MADTNDDGGPAFPLPKAAFPVITEKPPQVTGMTLLDYFAGQAIAGILASGWLGRHFRNNQQPGQSHGDVVEVGTIALCADAYQIADAMIAEKRRRESTK